MTIALLARMAAVGVLAAGLLLGGPQTMRPAAATEVVGSDPVQEDCNGTDKESTPCPTTADGKTCPTGNYDIIKSEQSGTALTSRFNNDQAVCSSYATSPCKKYTLKEASVDPVCKSVKTAIAFDKIDANQE